MAVRALPQDTIRLIKSTQVITTPASIVKELVENALDAGATAITIKMEKHGFSHIEVRDNGSGIKEEDVEFIAKPHYTSKISSFSDLACLTSYGFRGEALASLCAVSDVSVTTKTSTDTMAHIYTFSHQGHIVTVKPAAAPTGTAVIVSNLFKNIPVRRQYYNNLKRRKDEMKKVEDVVLAFSLAAPTKLCCAKSPAQDMCGALISTFPSVFKDLVKREFFIEDISVKVEAYLPNPENCTNPGLTRTTADRLFILVNRRPITHKSVEKLVKGLYKRRQEGSHTRYPVGVLSFTLPPESLDVNLEPNKTKVFFKDEDEVLEALKWMLIALYQPTNSSDVSAEAGDVDTDITCTFSAITQSPMHQHPPNVPKTTILNGDSCSNSVQEEENMFVEESATSKGRTEVPGMNQIENINDNKNVQQNIPEKTDSSNNSRYSDCTQNQNTSLILPATLKVIGRSERGISTNHVGKGSVITFENKVLTSTQDSKTDGIFPSVSDICVTPIERRHNCMEVTNDDIVGMQDNPQDQVSSLTECLQMTDDKAEDQREPVKPKSCVQEADSVIGGQCRQDTSKLHDTIMGSDGVPVYLIPPLPQPENVTTQNTTPNHTTPRDIGQNSEHDQSSVQNKQYNFKKLSSAQNSNAQNKPVCESPDACSTSSEAGQEGSKGGSWSRGGTINGKDIQTVRLLTPTVGPKSKDGQVGSVQGKRDRPEGGAGKESPQTPPKKVKVSSLGPTSFDYICGKPVKKPSSPFIIFSREIRSQVLSEHPGADLAFIAQQMAARWKALPPDQKLHYNNLAKTESEKYQEQLRKAQESRGLNTSIKPSVSRGRMTKGSLDRYVAPLTPNMVRKVRKDVHVQPVICQRPWQNRSRQIAFTVNAVKRKLSRRQAHTASCPAFSLIGCLSTAGGGGGWICVQQGSVTALNIYRLYERTLYHTLLSTFRLPMKSLDDALPFNASFLGQDNWNTLLQLPRELCADRNVYTVTDQRLTHSGFKVLLFPGANGVVTHGEVSHMTPAVGYIGIIDLKEILAAITANPTASLLHTRPLKIQHWIKAETVRMIRAGPNIVQRDDVMDKINRWMTMGEGWKDADDDAPVSQRDVCLHNKPILTRLYCLHDLSMSQSQLSL